MKTLNLALGLGDGMQPVPSDALHQGPPVLSCRVCVAHACVPRAHRGTRSGGL